MKKRILSVLLVVLMTAALMVTTAGCGADQESADRIAQLEQENAALKAQVEELTAQLEVMKQKAALESWNLSAEAWPDGNGATVTFTATPVNYVEGQTAALSVRMGDLEAESTACVWDSAASAFVGTLDLSAADGYSYYCILTSLDGSQEQIELTSPANPQNEALVYLGSNLTAYANLIVDTWEKTDTDLVISSGYIQVQTPRLSAGSEVTVNKAELVFQCNTEEVSRKEITLPAGEGEGSYELALTETSFTMPQMQDDYQLELWLEVTLSNGRTISISGGSWYYNGGELLMVVG